MYIASLEGQDMEQWTDYLNNLLKDKKFIIAYIQKSSGLFNVKENSAHFTARAYTDGCDSLPYIEIRHSYENVKNWAAFEIGINAIITITTDTIQIVTDCTAFQNFLIILQ